MHKAHFLAGVLLGCILTGGCYQDTPSSPQSALQALTELLHDRDARVRRTAADALGKIGDSTAEPLLASALRDEDPIVREAAARGLGRLSILGVDASAQLVLHLSDEDGSVRRAAAQALGMAEGTPALRHSLIGLLVSADVQVREAAAQALSLLAAPEPSVIDALITSAQDKNPVVRQWSLAALAESGSDRVLPVLMDRLRHDPVDTVRSEAAYRLRFIGSESSASQLETIAAEERSPIVRGWVETSGGALKKESDSGSTPRPGQPAAPAPSPRYQ